MDQEPLSIPDPSSNIHDSLLQSVFRKHSVIMLLIDPDTGQIVDAIHAAERFYGYSLSQLKEKFIFEINAQGSRHTASEAPDYFISLQKLANGEIRTLEIHTSPAVVDGNSVLFSILHDITEHEAGNEYASLFKSEQRDHQVNETLRAANLALIRDLNLDVVLGIFLEYLQQLIPYDSANVMLLQDDARLAIFAMRGYENFTDPTQTRAVVFDPHSHLAFGTIINEQRSTVIADTRTFPGWERLPGTEHVISWMGVPLIAGGRIIGIYSIDKNEPGFFTSEHQVLAETLAAQAAAAIQNARLFAHVQAELTERRHVEDALRESEERYRSLFDSMMDGIYRSTTAGKFVDINTAMVKMFGYASRDEMLEVDIKKELYFTLEERGSHILDTGREETEVYRMRRKDGAEIWVEDQGSYEHNEQGRIIYHVGMLRDVTERVRAEEAWNRQTEKLRLIYEASRQLNASFESQHIYDVTYNSISQLIPCNTLFISSFERRTSMISMVCGWHDGAPVNVKSFPPTPLEEEGQGAQSEVIRTGKPLLLSDYQQRLKQTKTTYHFDDAGNPVAASSFDDVNIPRSALIVPMIVENQVVGAIQVFSYQLNAYIENDLNLLNAFASQVAVALINSDLFQRAQRENRDRKRAETSLRSRTRELETLFAISNHISFVQTETEILPQILRELQRAIEADTMAVLLLEPDETRLNIVNASGDLMPNIGFKFDATEGISGAIIRSRHLYQTEDLSNDPLRIKDVHGMDHLGPAIFTPVLSGDHLIGVLLSARRKGKHTRSFTPEVTRMIITASEMLGNAINRVRLHAETMRRLDHLQTLRAMDQVIASSLDLRITLNILLNHTMTQLGVDAADVLLLHPYQQTLQHVAGQGFRTRAIESADVHLNDAFAGRSVMERRIVQIFDSAQIIENQSFAHLWTEENFLNYICVPLIAKGEVKGVLEVYHRSPFTPDAEWLEFLETLAGQAAITIDNSQMFDNLQRVNMELAIAYDATIEGWSRAMDLRDKETEGHTRRVTDLTVSLAKAMGIKDKEILHIRRGALLHDIGKMGIPDHILLKQGPLTSREWKIMHTHPALAYEMLQPIRYLYQSLDIPNSHHEKWDGTGYPRGLKGERIPLVARIFAIADVWDAVTSARPYRKAWTKEKALAYIKEQSGKHFDPQVVEVFLQVIK